MTAYEQQEHDAIIRRTLMAEDPNTRSLTDRERELLTHISRFGAQGYPVQKVGSHHWTHEASVRVFPTKREAVASFEMYYSTLRDLAGVEAYRKATSKGGR